LAGSEDASNLKVSLKRNRNGLISAEITSYRVTDHNQKPLHRVFMLKDMTELGRLQEQLIQADKLAALGQLVSGVSHELNNPLSSIIQYIELLQTFSPTDQLVQDCLDRMSKEAERTRRIVNNLLSFARTHETGHVEVDINELLDATLELRAYSLRVDNITVQRELGDIPKVVADRHKLQQVFLNIIINAEQAMKTKRPGNSLIVKTEHFKNGEPEHILIQITDNGPGIDPKNIEKVFEPFFTTKPGGQGTGLGLSISQKIVNDHGGSIWVRSSPGEGATFFIKLQLVSQKAPDASDEVID
jgi:two-component system NtrC family sensor kinase